jgi:hypothetical protein
MKYEIHQTVVRFTWPGEIEFLSHSLSLSLSLSLSVESFGRYRKRVLVDVLPCDTMPQQCHVLKSLSLNSFNIKALLSAPYPLYH